MIAIQLGANAPRFHALDRGKNLLIKSEILVSAGRLGGKASQAATMSGQSYRQG